MSKVLCKIGCGYNQTKTVFDPVYGFRTKSSHLNPWCDKDYPNKDGDCKYYSYERKWWKFWIKDNKLDIPNKTLI